MTSTDQRVWRLEQQIQRLADELAKALAAIAAIRQATWALPGDRPGSGGGGVGVWVCVPSAAIPANGSLVTQTVKAVSGGVETALPGTFTIYNQMAGPAAASKKGYVLPDGAGNYNMISQSCV